MRQSLYYVRFSKAFHNVGIKTHIHPDTDKSMAGGDAAAACSNAVKAAKIVFQDD